MVALATILAACSGSDAEPSAGALPTTDAGTFEALIAESESPMVVNLWASWCVPCRSEAPLLVEAHRQLGQDVRFIGIATEDTQVDAESFVAEFSMTFENYFDRSGEVKAWVGSVGLPTTFFVAPGGEVVSTVFGVIDERRLALEIDDLLRR
jgi:cytochrome c biogenesis protein CcmG/thiol:disulfide interchange protein DsbE